MSVNTQLADIQRTLGEHTGTLSGIKDDLKKTRDNTGKLFGKNTDARERLAKLEQRADGFERQASNRGAISGGLIGGMLIGIRLVWEWVAGR